ncbi:MAG: phage tail tape measure C-terminal domain-containing protein [Alphaproteobacteria bacterium]|nr:phage tail tape measure C-terminal domain-containing protein [Alphaproteobacteria bacterium]
MPLNVDAGFRIAAGVTGQQAVDRLGGTLRQLVNTTNSLSRNFSLLTNAAKTYFGLAALKSAIDVGDAMNDLNIKTGVSVETLSKLKVVAEQNGSSLEGLATGYKFMLNNQSEAIYGNKQAIQSFKEIGISVADLKKMNSEQLFLTVAQRVGELGRESDRTKVLMDIFGKSGSDLGVVMAEGADGIKKTMDQVERMGLVLTKEDAQRMDEFNDKWTLFTNTCIRWLQSGFVGAFDTFVKLRNTMIGSDLRVPTGDLDNIEEVSNRLQVLNRKKRQAQEALRDEDDPKQFGKYRDMITDFQRQIDEAQGKAAGMYGPQPQPAGTAPAPKRGLRGSALDKLAERDYERDIEQLQKYIEKERQQNITMAQQADYIGLTSVEIEKLKAARQIDAEVAEKTLSMSPAVRKQFEEQAEAIKKQRLEIIQLNYEQSRTFSTGTKQFMSEYVETIGDAAARAKDMWSSAFKGMEDALTDFVSTGKVSFGSLAQSIIKDMIRIQIQQSVTGPLASWIGSLNPFGGAGQVYSSPIGPMPGTGVPMANGGIMTSRGKLPLHMYSSGGIARSPQMALFGEAGLPEAYVPLPDGNRIPVNLKGGSGGNSIVNNVNISISTNGETEASGTNANLTQFGRLMSATAKNVIMNEMRPGGMLAQQRAG